MLLAVSLVVTLSAEAQKSDEKQFKFGAGILLCRPIGDMTCKASLALGFNLLGEYAIVPEIA